MQQIYGHRWLSAYGDSDTDGTWAVGLSGLTPEDIGTGLRACIDKAIAWPPTLPEFRSLCKPEKRENEAMYRFPPSRQLPHKLTDESRGTARAALAAARQSIKG